jgi:hypothetical protein
MFDFGKEVQNAISRQSDSVKGNMAHYNQSTPPLYDLSKYPAVSMTLHFWEMCTLPSYHQDVPLGLFTGNADELADPST